MLEPNGEFEPITKLAVRLPVTPFMVHENGPISNVPPLVTAIVHPPSDGLNPVPEIVIVVPAADGGPVTGGLPLVGLNFTAAVTVKVAMAETSPFLPVIETEYACPGALAETRNCEPEIIEPPLTRQFTAVANPAGTEETVQAPSSVELNPAPVIGTTVPADPLTTLIPNVGVASTPEGCGGRVADRVAIEFDGVDCADSRG